MDNQARYAQLTWIAVIFAFIVVMVGAFTRLSDAGLGCPDWPGCYGQLIAPTSNNAISQAQQAFPGQVVETGKAWIEMSHRYLAGMLGVLIFVLCMWGLQFARKWYLPSGILMLTMAVVIFQALLGMWTVTLKLMPLVVMGHLLGGFLLLSLLWWLNLVSNNYFAKFQAEPLLEDWHTRVLLAIVLLVLQIILGGWTSANYAALSCTSLPFCNSHASQGWSFIEAFQLWAPYDQLSLAAKQTIQMIHRLGAIAVMVVVGWIAIRLITSSRAARLQNLGWFILAVLIIQLLLGLSNVLFSLPLIIAIAHNAFAAILLLSLISAYYALYQIDLSHHVI